MIREEGDSPLVAGRPLSIAMVTGDFDLSGIGTVTHVEGDRVYGFGHPMFSLGTCDFPMMTGFIHTVYPRASVSMKMGSPLKVVGVLDTDVSTGVAGRIGPKPDMLPVSVRVKTGRYSDPRPTRSRWSASRTCCRRCSMAVLTNAIDTEGNLPEELTARIKATIQLKGIDPIALIGHAQRPALHRPDGGGGAVQPDRLDRQHPGAQPDGSGPDRGDRLRGRDRARADGRHDRVGPAALRPLEPGEELKAFVTLKPFKGERQTVEVALPLPDDFPEGALRGRLLRRGDSLRRRFRNEPPLLEPRDLDGVIEAIRLQTEPKRTAIYLHVPSPDRGLAVQGQAAAEPAGQRPGRLRLEARSPRPQPIRSDLVTVEPDPWVVEGTQTLRFTVVKDAGLSYRYR